jgi:hypothetical protein
MHVSWPRRCDCTLHNVCKQLMDCVGASDIALCSGTRGKRVSGDVHSGNGVHVSGVNGHRQCESQWD